MRLLTEIEGHAMALADCAACRCGKPILRCASQPGHVGCSSGHGWIHAEPNWGHSCRPRSGAPYARPDGDPTPEHPVPVKVRTARKAHDCDDCSQPIEVGEKYELLVTPPHRLAEYDVPRWLTWRTHYPRHDGMHFLIGCDVSAAYREHAARAVAGAAR